MEENTRSRHVTMAFPKIGMQHMGPPQRHPPEFPCPARRSEIYGGRGAWAACFRLSDIGLQPQRDGWIGTRGGWRLNVRAGGGGGTKEGGGRRNKVRR